MFFINTSIYRVLTIYLCVFLIQAVFQQFDLDGSGTVDTYELDKLFSTLGERERDLLNDKNVDFLTILFDEKTT